MGFPLQQPARIAPTPRRRRGFLRWLHLGLVWLLVFPPAARAEKGGAEIEYKIKAVALLKLSAFVEWPAGAFEGNAPFVIAVLGDDPFGAVLDQAVAGETIQQRPVVVRRLARGAAVTGCHLVFVSRSEKDALAPLFAATRDLPVLTVSDIDGFAASGGLIGLPVQQKSVRFEINLAAAQRARLKISSRLSAIARVIEPPSRSQP